MYDNNVRNDKQKLVMINKNKIVNRVTFKRKTGYYLEFLSPGTMKLFGNTKSKITNDKNVENMPHLEITEVILVNCNIASNNYKHNSKVVYTFIPNKSFGQFLDISSKNFIILKTFNSGFSYIKVWFTDQNSKPLEIEDEINITLVIS